jgi:hypothetical protein
LYLYDHHTINVIAQQPRGDPTDDSGDESDDHGADTAGRWVTGPRIFTQRLLRFTTITTTVMTITFVAFLFL